MLVPPPDVLAARLTVDGALQPLEGVELVLRVDATDLGEGGAWVPAAVPGVSLLATVESGGRQLTVQLPPGPLGLGLGNPDDELAARAITVEPADRKPRRSLLPTAALERLGPRRVRAHLEGALAAGTPWTLLLEGTPTVVQVTVVAAEGRRRAQALLEAALPGLDGASPECSEHLAGRPGDETLVLRWQPAELLALEAAQRAAWRREEEEAEQRALDALRSRPVPEPTADAPLVAGRQVHLVRRATLALSGPGGARPGFQLRLELEVGATPGEDGALEPTFEYEAAGAPFALPLDGAWHPLPLGSGSVEAWYGNDAPELEAQAFAFRVLSPGEAEVDWTATYEDWTTRQRETLRFLGRATLVGAG